MFFRFEQNNAGGFFVEGLPETLFVEAPSPDEANTIAEANGVDFEDGCPGCCGDRWNRVYDAQHGMDAIAFAEAIALAIEFNNTYRVVTE
jgi:hypothetical protein